MAGINTKLFNERVGQIKILALILGLIGVILTADNWVGIAREEIFWWSNLVCLIISAVLFVLALVGVMENENFKKLDKLYHCVAAILLIVSACFFIYSVDYYHNNSIYSLVLNYERRAAAGAFGLAFGLVCGWIGSFLLF